MITIDTNSDSTVPMQHPFFSRSGFILWFAATVGAICVLPYMFALAPEALDEAVNQTGIPVVLIVGISIFQSALLLGFMTFTGLWAAKKIGLGAPILDALVNKAPLAADTRKSAIGSIGLGTAGAFLLIALDVWVFLPLDPEGLGAIQSSHPPAWMGLFASLYGGIAEEIQLRLFLFSLLILGVTKLASSLRLSSSPSPSVTLFWLVNIFVAVVFGLAHLPATAELLPLTPLIVLRAIVLNGIIGLAAGFLYWRKGIEMAMLCHFSADIILHVGLPAITD